MGDDRGGLGFKRRKFDILSESLGGQLVIDFASVTNCLECPEREYKYNDWMKDRGMMDSNSTNSYLDDTKKETPESSVSHKRYSLIRNREVAIPS